MNSDFLLQILLRLLPTILIFGLAFVAAADRKTRERWAQLLYQIGNIRHDQQDDPKVQRSVRWPFFIVAILFLILPIRYYLRASRTLEVVPTAAPSPIMPAGTPPATPAVAAPAPGVAAPTPGSVPLTGQSTPPPVAPTPPPSLGGPIPLR